MQPNLAKMNPIIGIIGFGRFGTLSACVLSKHFPVKVHNPRLTPEKIEKAEKMNVGLTSLEEIAKSDIIILTAPIVKTEELIKNLAKIAKPGSLILDTCSVKVYPCRWLKKYVPKNIEVMGTHPMFGPVTSKFELEKMSYSLDGLQIVLCPLRISEDRLEKIKKFLKSLGLNVIISSPEEHDKQNAKTLSLVHFVGRALNEAKISPQKIFTPGYTDLLKIMPHTNSDDWQLFFDMNNFNPYADSTRKKFMRACQNVEEKIMHSRKRKFPNNKHQITNKSQYQNSNFKTTI